MVHLKLLLNSIFFCSLVWLFLFTSNSDAVHPSAVYRSFHQNDHFTVPFPNSTGNSTLSPKCQASFDKLKNSSIAESMAYIDAMGKPQSGFELGNLAWFGSYSECKNITEAHYCLASIKINLKNGNKTQTLPVQWGLCVPETCNDDDITNGLEKILNWTGNIIQLNHQAQMFTAGGNQERSVHCAKPSKYTSGVIATLTLCGVILYLCLVGTLLDIVSDCMKPTGESSLSKNDGFMPAVKHSKDQYDGPLLNSDISSSTTPFNSPSRFGDYDTAGSSIPLLVYEKQEGCAMKVMKFFQCFSLIKNTSRILDTKAPPGAITSINGMRVLSMWWVILGHVFVWQLIGGNVSNLGLAFLHLLNRFSFQAVANAFFFVDSFFFLSGLLVSYLSFRQMERKKGSRMKINPKNSFRLTPTYMFVLLFYDKLTGFLGEGPTWFQMQTNPACDKYWWTNLLYINNFWPTSLGKECMNWSWYLANDMQFYIISPIILLATNRFGKRGFIITTAILLLAHFIATAAIIGYYDLNTSNMLGGGENPNNRGGNMPDFSSLVYVKPYCRIAPYLVGMALGYVFHLQKDSTKKPNWVIMLVGWCVAIALALSVVYGPYKSIKQPRVPFTKFENIMYGTFSRFAWGLALAWVVYACHRGFGGLVNRILSAHLWIPLSRLTYTAYLVHPIVLFTFFASFETVLAYSDLHLAFYFAGTVSLSYSVAFIVSVCVEFPMLQLEKLLFNRDR
ncbi:hypothetical protein ACROYT_G013819 [Oculina patagonica]